MNTSRYIMIVAAILSIVNLSAAPKKGGGNSQQSALAKIKKEDEARTQMAQQYLNDLRPIVPNLHVSDIKVMSPSDVRSLYVRLYVSQGTPKADAMRKADALTIFGQVL